MKCTLLSGRLSREYHHLYWHLSEPLFGWALTYSSPRNPWGMLSQIWYFPSYNFQSIQLISWKTNFSLSDNWEPQSVRCLPLVPLATCHQPATCHPPATCLCILPTWYSSPKSLLPPYNCLLFSPTSKPPSHLLPATLSSCSSLPHDSPFLLSAASAARLSPWNAWTRLSKFSSTYSPHDNRCLDYTNI